MHSVRSVLIGLGTTFVFIMMLQTFAGVFWPGVNLNDAQTIAAAPLLLKFYVVLPYGISVFVGAFLARKIAGGINTIPSWIVGGVYTLVCAVIAFSTPAPLWMLIATVALPLPAAWLGMTLAAERRRVVPNANHS